jgi:hypothetical protein
MNFVEAMKTAAETDETGDRSKAIEMITHLLDLDRAKRLLAPDERARALNQRGRWRFGEDGAGAIEDYTAVLELAQVSPGQKAEALLNRGEARRSHGDARGGILDCTAVFELHGASDAQKAVAVQIRASNKAYIGDFSGAVEDLSLVMRMPGADKARRAKAQLMRAEARGQARDRVGEMDDLNAVIAMTDIPVDTRANALFRRGWLRQDRDPDAAALDYRAVLRLPDVSEEFKDLASGWLDRI